MENPISVQLFQALVAIMLGIVYGVIYDVLRFVRYRFCHWTVTAMCDLLFAFCVCLGLFLLGYSTGDNEQQVFMSVFASLAMALYLASLGHFCRHIIAQIFRFMGKILKILLFPAAIVLIYVKKISKNLKNIFYYEKKRYTINSVYKFLKVGGRNTGRKDSEAH